MEIYDVLVASLFNFIGIHNAAAALTTLSRSNIKNIAVVSDNSPKAAFRQSAVQSQICDSSTLPYTKCSLTPQSVVE